MITTSNSPNAHKTSFDFILFFILSFSSLFHIFLAAALAPHFFPFEFISLWSKQQCHHLFLHFDEKSFPIISDAHTHAQTQPSNICIEVENKERNVKKKGREKKKWKWKNCLLSELLFQLLHFCFYRLNSFFIEYKEVTRKKAQFLDICDIFAPLPESFKLSPFQMYILEMSQLRCI